jgi:hypothetical protein
MGVGSFMLDDCLKLEDVYKVAEGKGTLTNRF